MGGVDVLRRCPHCGTIWAKVSGCEGMTTCGSKAAAADVASGTMAHFTFHWHASGRWDIGRTSVETVRKANSGGVGVGCGKQVTWSEMQIVPVPKCLSDVPTDALLMRDINNIKPQHQRVEQEGLVRVGSCTCGKEASNIGTLHQLM